MGELGVLCRDRADNVQCFIYLKTKKYWIHQRSAIFKYLTCGESAERGTILRVQGRGGISASFLFPELTKFRAEESVQLVLTSRGQIHDLLPPLSQPRAVDSLNFDVTDERDHHPVRYQ